MGDFNKPAQISIGVAHDLCRVVIGTRTNPVPLSEGINGNDLVTGLEKLLNLAPVGRRQVSDPQVCSYPVDWRTCCRAGRQSAKWKTLGTDNGNAWILC